jgi:hypothetical protein
MKQYKINTGNLPPIDESDDCYIAPNDPLQELKIIQTLAGLNAQGRLQEYRANTQEKVAQGSNISITGTEKAELMRKRNIQPGTPEWFKLWFSRPLWFKEGPDR